MAFLKRKTIKEKMSGVKLGGIDLPFLILVLCLLGFGLVMVCSASYVSAYYTYGDSFYFFRRQLFFALGGLVIMLVIAFGLKPDWLRKRTMIILVIALILAVLVLIPGVGIKVNGARRWLGVGGLRLQPSEVVKFAMIVFLSSYVARNYERLKKFNSLLPAVLTLVLFTGLVAIETHISGAILIFCVGVIMLLIGGMSIRTFLTFGGVGVGAITLIVLFTDYAKERINTWLDPFLDPLGDGFQTIQSLYAISSGGLGGLGLGQSRQKHLYLPEPHNDYIFSIICEELGFIGALVVILLFVLLIWRGFTIAFHHKDRFSSMLVIGIVSRVAIQAIFNMMVVTNLFPSTGISLPFFSYGGTALVILMAEVGIVLRISRESTLDTQKE
ncbi:MAG: putative lipid II flippase FtsW [Clostridia bacterium]|nr:putative lipid II flippase FtsW [Clostridia bacterium]